MKNKKLPLNTLYATSDAARFLDVSQSCIVWYADAKKIPCIKTVRGQRLFTLRDLRKFKKAAA